jgi:spore germination protein GerM
MGMAGYPGRDSTTVQRALLLFGLLLLFALGLLVSASLQPPVRTLYWVRDDGSGATLVAAPRRLRGQDTEALARTLVEVLAAGPLASERAAGLSSEVPGETRVLGVVVTADALRVDLSSAVMAGGGSHSMLGRVLQLQYSLSELPGVEGVSLWVEGLPAPLWGGEGLMVPDRWVRPAAGLPRW